jgi:hypothetical protein
MDVKLGLSPQMKKTKPAVENRMLEKILCFKTEKVTGDWISA